MKKNIRFAALICGMTLFAGQLLAHDWQVVYQTDFSSDPGWVTNSIVHYYWDSTDSVYFSSQINVNNGGYYAAYDTGLSLDSFKLEWDIQISSNNYASDLRFGLLDSDFNVSEHGSFACVMSSQARNMVNIL